MEWLTQGVELLFQGANFTRLLSGLGLTARITAFTVLFSVLLGFPLGFLMNSKRWPIKILTKLYLEFFRLMPQLVLLFVFYYSFSTALEAFLGITISPELSTIIVFSFWGAAEFGDLVRGAIKTIPWGQTEAGLTLGLSRLKLAVFITIPQIIRLLIPPLVNLITRIIKTTSIAGLIGVIEVIKVGQQIIDFNKYTTPLASIWVYGIIFVLYFIICWPLSLLANYLEKRLTIAI